MASGCCRPVAEAYRYRDDQDCHRHASPGIYRRKTVLKRCDPEKLDELLHPVFDKKILAASKPITNSAARITGSCYRTVVFHADEAEAWAKDGKVSLPYRNLARRPAKVWLHPGYSTARRYDFTCGRCGPRYGQMLRFGCKRCINQGAEDDHQRQGVQRRRLDLAERYHR